MHTRPAHPRSLGILAGLLFLASTPPALAQVFVDQVNGGAAPCGGLADPCEFLSDGIAAAAPGDIILVGDGFYTETDLLIDFDVTIEAAPGAGPILDAGGADRHFQISGTAANPLTSVALRGLTLQQGYRSASRGGSIKARWVDDLTLEDMVFIDNVAVSDGGALAATGVNVTIVDSEFRKNLSTALGGAIYFDARRDGTTLTISGSLLAENHARQEGGAIYNTGGDVELIEDTLADNEAGDPIAATPGYGGAIRSIDGSVTVRRSTFNANRALQALASGGAIDASGATVNDIVIYNSTFFANEVANGEGAALEIGGNSTAAVRFSTFKDNVSASAFAGFYPAAITNHGTLEIRGTIVAGSNTGLGSDCDGIGTATGIYNRIDGACFGVTGELTPVTGLAATLALNGGDTENLTLDAASNAIDIVPTGLPFPGCLVPIDQRNSPRPDPAGAAFCDIGSVEAF